MGAEHFRPPNMFPQQSLKNVNMEQQKIIPFWKPFSSKHENRLSFQVSHSKSKFDKRKTMQKRDSSMHTETVKPKHLIAGNSTKERDPKNPSFRNYLFGVYGCSCLTLA